MLAQEGGTDISKLYLANVLAGLIAGQAHPAGRV